MLFCGHVALSVIASELSNMLVIMAKGTTIYIWQNLAIL